MDYCISLCTKAKEKRKKRKTLMCIILGYTSFLLILFCEIHDVLYHILAYSCILDIAIATVTYL